MVNSRLFAIVGLLFCVSAPLVAAPLTISGKVFNEANGEPIEFGTVVIPEAKFKSRVNADGSYAAAVPNAGEYTVIITSPGLSNLTQKIR
ncbi:MAG: carboxypeptidase-like regulatory domain-containing protein, partial [Spirochaetes bacterium]|nr:carboxypeptidase-like regulatory domain-containing protein [Spirochaetota bacterium]